jgi:hypothetical protein
VHKSAVERRHGGHHARHPLFVSYSKKKSTMFGVILTLFTVDTTGFDELGHDIFRAAKRGFTRLSIIACLLTTSKTVATRKLSPAVAGNTRNNSLCGGHSPDPRCL